MFGKSLANASLSRSGIMSLFNSHINIIYNFPGIILTLLFVNQKNYNKWILKLQLLQIRNEKYVTVELLKSSENQTNKMEQILKQLIILLIV